VTKITGQCWVGCGVGSIGRSVGIGIGTLPIGNQKVQKGRPYRESIYKTGPSFCRRSSQVARARHSPS